MHNRMNYLAPAGFICSIAAFLLAVLSGLCVFGVLLTPTWGAVIGIVSLICACEGLTMTAIARSEIVENAQFGDEFAVSGMVVGIVVCAFSVAALVLYFLLFR